jgi:hypothetical protein
MTCACVSLAVAGRGTIAFTKTNTTVFTVPREAFVELRAEDRVMGDMADDVNFLSSLSWLRGTSQNSVVKLAFHSHKRVHSRGTVIVQEGTGTCARAQF